MVEEKVILHCLSLASGLFLAFLVMHLCMQQLAELAVPYQE